MTVSGLPVLVGLPVHPESLRFLAPNLAYWESERAGLAEVVVAANGVWSMEHLDELSRLEREFPFARFRRELLSCEHDGPWGNLLAAQSLLWRVALEEGHSHLLFHEVTRFPVPGALERLLDCRLPVVGALYKCSHSAGSYTVFAFIGESDRHCRPYTLVNWSSRPTRVAAIGFGFTLFSRDVLSRLAPRDPRFPADHAFAKDAQRLGIPIHAAPFQVENVKVDRRWTGWSRWWLARPARILLDLFRR